ncbi:hypothetical protein AAUPMB_08749, partial [Pasteurella multocida subsp. multocida str. Anand1_buffalo]
CSVYSYTSVTFKRERVFFGNIYFQYADIHQVNLAENNILVIDMKNGKRLLVHLLTDQDREQVIQFFWWL